MDRAKLGIDWIPSFEFPTGTRNDYLYTASLVFGCVRGTDTLVSAFADRFGEPQVEFISYQPIRELSNSPASSAYDASALAEQEYYAVFFDTTVFPNFIDAADGRRHKPIGLEIHQTSLSWSNGFASRFIIVNYWLKNIGKVPIENVAIGFEVNPAIYSDRTPHDVGTLGNICGFLPVAEGIVKGMEDTVNIAWAACTTGDPAADGTFASYSVRGVLGVRALRSPSGGLPSFNWWAYTSDGGSWGPRGAGVIAGASGSLGAPYGDRYRYRMMLNGEVDYDQAFAAVDMSPNGWSPPLLMEKGAREIAEGAHADFLLSYGPLSSIAIGDSVAFTVALIAGDNFHTDPYNFADRFNPRDPQPYLSHLNFSDLITNARWADWVFDNPGVDSDHNGNRGRAYLVNCTGQDSTHCDSVFFKGDGIPDWNGPHAPTPPRFELVTGPGKAALRWNGALTELERDPISRKRDFEGYRIYAGRFSTDDQLSLVASWDREDFKRLAYQAGSNDWQQISDPMTVDQWRLVLGNPGFAPQRFVKPSMRDAYVDSFWDTTRTLTGEIINVQQRERYSYWAIEAANRANEYLDEGRPETNIIQLVAQRDTIVDGEQLTYGVYEVSLSNLQASVPLYFAITTFDFGDYEKNLEPMESSPANNSQYGQPIYSADVVKDSGIKVSVYPNPYKIAYNDAFGHRTNYFAEGYEGYGNPVMTEYDRRIHFINLPDTATIRIYTLAGDLIREIHHPDRFLTTYSSEVGWDLISRNAQPVTSGIYIYRVDSRSGSQIGKIVIIK